jgi:hypothetical protein
VIGKVKIINFRVRFGNKLKYGLGLMSNYGNTCQQSRCQKLCRSKRRYQDDEDHDQVISAQGFFCAVII